MIQRRQFFQTAAAGCALTIAPKNVFGMDDENVALPWPCKIVQTEPHQYPSEPPVVTDVSIQPGGNLIAIVGDDHFVSVFDSKLDDFAFNLGEHTDWVRTTEFSPDGKWLATAGNDRRLRLWDAKQLHEKPNVIQYRYAIIDVAFSPNSICWPLLDLIRNFEFTI